jgi:hypothetical protein
MSPKMTMTQDVVARTLCRYAVGLVIKTDEVSEQLSCPREGTKMDEHGVGLAHLPYEQENRSRWAGDEVMQTLVP